jgi:hypothetical protein
MPSMLINSTCWMGLESCFLPDSWATADDAASRSAPADTPALSLREKFMGFPPGDF